MEILPVSQATPLVTSVFTSITSNIPALLVVLGAFVGLKIVANLFNSALRGNISVGAPTGKGTHDDWIADGNREEDY